MMVGSYVLMPYTSSSPQNDMAQNSPVATQARVASSQAHVESALRDLACHPTITHELLDRLPPMFRVGHSAPRKGDVIPEDMRAVRLRRLCTKR
jgi:hypothetical protein